MSALADAIALLQLYGRMALVGGGVVLALGLALADRQADPAQASAPLLILQR